MNTDVDYRVEEGEAEDKSDDEKTYNDTEVAVSCPRTGVIIPTARHKPGKIIMYLT